VKTLFLGFVAILVLAAAYLAGLAMGWYGQPPGPGEITEASIPSAVLTARSEAQQRAALAARVQDPKQILFGDLHVHTTYSTDAFLFSLPMMGGEGLHPLADACDFARFCSGLDFWSINDHAEASTPRKWRDTKESIRHCNAVASEPAAPDVMAFLGWEWTQVGTTPEGHWGHKNVILRGLSDDEVPARPINSGGFTRQIMKNIPFAARFGPALLEPSDRQRYYDWDAFAREIAAATECPAGVDVRELPEDCVESADTPELLFEKLDQWGLESIVIPHGTAWGIYTPRGSDWRKQLNRAQHDPERQTLIEVYSGHGNSEEYRDYRNLEELSDGSVGCPEPHENFLPSCWRAGELIRERCLAAGIDADDCEERAALARQRHVDGGMLGKHVVPGARMDDWLDSGQCRDCFLPAFNLRPRGSAQYIAALGNFDEAEPQRFRFGFIASSDVHTARPGTGYKEFARRHMADQYGPQTEAFQRFAFGEPGEQAPESVPAPTLEQLDSALQATEFERQQSFWLTGGLVGVHAASRTRDGVWEALERKEVYGTSGERILLWFDLVNAPGAAGELPMGSEVAMSQSPRFRVRAVGAFEQKPGCPEYSTRSLDAERLASLCKDECYHPSDTRKAITRVEIVRIRPETRAGEPMDALIEDPWLRLYCPGDPSGCSVEFEDPKFADAARDTVYYARAVQEPSPAVNGANLRCEYDSTGNCIAVRPCHPDFRTPDSDECLSDVEERAWSSPIYVDWSG